jgi:GntR family transcriptional regulator
MTETVHKPLYLQIQETLAERILSGKLSPESKLPSERDYSAELGVSRMTVRRSITELVNEGLLERRHGSGTYVAKPRVDYNASELISYTNAMQTRGIAVSSQLIEFSETAASRRMSERLAVSLGDPLYRVAILRLGNRIPFVLERALFPCERLPGLEEYDLEKNSIYTLLTNAYQVELGGFSQAVEAVAAGEEIAKQLRIEVGSPLLLVARTIFRKCDGKPVLTSQDFLRSDFARIHMAAEW